VTSNGSVSGCPLCQGNGRKKANQRVDNKLKRIGIDIGGVIIDRAKSKENTTEDNDEDTSFSANYLKTPAKEHSFESIAQLIKQLGKDNVFIVSKCGPSFRTKTLEWLEYPTDFIKKDN
jgi:hypothetical protein